jgi:hypothetical protein
MKTDFFFLKKKKFMSDFSFGIIVIRGGKFLVYIYIYISEQYKGNGRGKKKLQKDKLLVLEKSARTMYYFSFN